MKQANAMHWTVHGFASFPGRRRAAIFGKEGVNSGSFIPRGERYVLAYFNCPKFIKQRMMISGIVQVVQMGASHDLTGRVTDLQHTELTTK